MNWAIDQSLFTLYATYAITSSSPCYFCQRIASRGWFSTSWPVSQPKSHLNSVLGENEGFHGRPGWLNRLLGGTLLQPIHLREYLHLLVNALDFLQTHVDPSPDIQMVEISADFVIGLSAVHSSPYIGKSGFQLLPLAVPLDLSLSLFRHRNQV